MKYVICSRCGQTMPDSHTHCQVCGTAIKNQSHPAHNRAQKRFVIWFILLTIFCFSVAIWLPR
jgi:predicted amidophosphoribosyltransferase